MTNKKTVLYFRGVLQIVETCVWFCSKSKRRTGLMSKSSLSTPISVNWSNVEEHLISMVKSGEVDNYIIQSL